VTVNRAQTWDPRRVLQSAKDLQARKPFLIRLVQEFQRLEPFDRAMTLAAQAFTSIFPLVISAFSVLGLSESGQLGARLADALALPEGTAAALEDIRGEPSGQVATFTALSLLIVLLSATSFSRALTRMYAKTWSVRAPGWRRSGWRWIAAIVAIASCTVALQVVERAARGSEAAVAGAVLLVLAVNSVLWTWVPSVLLARQVSWRLLALGGVFMGAASVVLTFASRIYLPVALKHAGDRYGELGVAFTLIGWLFAVAFVLICATVLGSVLSREPGPLARLLARRASAGPAIAAPSPDTSRTAEQAATEG
jgi:membrane protein